jgi:tRNA threonylcarbamoyladenosine biosynthesis protein TsaB
MNVLAIDTATAVNTVALCRGSEILAETVVNCHRAHSERLMGTIDWVLAEGGCPLEDIDLLAVSNGPGSFTGLRIGVSAMKGLALALNVPLVAVPTLDALARQAPMQNGVVCVMLDARMKEVFGAVYRYESGHHAKIITDRVCPVGELCEALPPEPAFFLGDGAYLYQESIQALRPNASFAARALGVPRASSVALEAIRLFGKGARSDGASVSPVYLRKSQAELAREQRETQEPPP